LATVGTGSRILLQSTVTGTLATAPGTVIEIANDAPVFDGTGAAFNNPANVVIDPLGKLTLKGVINNTGSITLTNPGSYPYNTDTETLDVAAVGVTLQGGGTVMLGGNYVSNNIITGDSAAATLTNVDNTISGAGNFGQGRLTLVNQAGGTINATGGVRDRALSGRCVR